MKIKRRLSAATLLLFSAGVLAQQSTLIIRSDAACALTVNGMPQGQVAAGTAKAVPVGGGEQLVECVAAGGTKAEEILEVFPGAQKVVQIKLARKTELSVTGEGTVVADAKSGLYWLRKDNGRDIDWYGAKSYCSGISPGSWSLPTMAQLQGLVGNTELFLSDGTFFWSSESDGSSEAGRLVPLIWLPDFVIDKARNARALCVRRSP